MTAARPSVFVVRHGATDWSEQGRHTGRTDIPLNQRGREQAARTRALLEDRRFGLVLVSPRQRAIETCRGAGYLDRAVVDDDLAEWDYGQCEGRTTTEIRQTMPGWTIWDGPVPEGESLAQVSARADRVITRARQTDGDVALFAHGHILRVLAARWCGLDPVEGRHLPLATATLSCLGWEHDTPGIVLWNQPA